MTCASACTLPRSLVAQALGALGKLESFEHTLEVMRSLPTTEAPA